MTNFDNYIPGNSGLCRRQHRCFQSSVMACYSLKNDSGLLDFLYLNLQCYNHRHKNRCIHNCNHNLFRVPILAFGYFDYFGPLCFGFWALLLDLFLCPLLGRKMKLTGGSPLQTNLCRPNSAGRIRCRWDIGTESLGTEIEERKKKLDIVYLLKTNFTFKAKSL